MKQETLLFTHLMSSDDQKMSTLTFMTRTTAANISTMVEYWFVPVDILTITMSILTFIFNGLCLLIIILTKTCHTVSMMLIANTCLIGFFYAMNRLSMVLFVLENDLQQNQNYYLLCILQGYLTYAVHAALNYLFFLQALYLYDSHIADSYDLFTISSVCKRNE